MAGSPAPEETRPGSGGWFARKAKEFLLGTPVELADPAKIHISQVADEVYNPGSPNSSANCGPTSVIMAIRLVNRPVPGEHPMPSSSPTTYTISDLAREFDLTTRAIRFYEDMGLLQPERSGPAMTCSPSSSSRAIRPDGSVSWPTRIVSRCRTARAW